MKEIHFGVREILPLTHAYLGVIITEEEAAYFTREGYLVNTTLGEDDPETQYYVNVWIAASENKAEFDMAMAETAGRADVVAVGALWRVGRRSGIKLFAKTVKVKE